MKASEAAASASWITAATSAYPISGRQLRRRDDHARRPGRRRWRRRSPLAAWGPTRSSSRPRSSSGPCWTKRGQRRASTRSICAARRVSRLATATSSTTPSTRPHLSCRPWQLRSGRVSRGTRPPSGSRSSRPAVISALFGEPAVVVDQEAWNALGRLAAEPTSLERRPSAFPWRLENARLSRPTAVQSSWTAARGGAGAWSR